MAQFRVLNFSVIIRLDPIIYCSFFGKIAVSSTAMTALLA